MKKILSLVFLVVVLVWTWNVIHSQNAVGFETHSGIQMRLAEMIKNTLLSKKPEATDFEVVRLWTETINDSKVKAIFSYKFKEILDGEPTEQKIDGEAILERAPSEASTAENIDRWILQDFKATNDALVFEQGTVVTPTAGADENATPPAEGEKAPAPTEQKPAPETH